MTNDLSYHCFPKIDTYVDVACYSVAQHVDHELGKWVMNDARYGRFKLESIHFFREMRDSDRREYLLTDTVVPTDYCMMEYYDEWEKKHKSVMVVGNAEEMNERLATVAHEVGEKSTKLYEAFKKF